MLLINQNKDVENASWTNKMQSDLFPDMPKLASQYDEYYSKLLRNMILTESDFERARILAEEEKINPLTKEQIFISAIYCILAQRENYQKQYSIFQSLLKNDIRTAEDIINKWDLTERVLDKAIDPSRKKNYIYRFSEKWINSDLPQRIIEDCNNLREKEFELRNELVEEFSGIGFKTASLLMEGCGYENIASLDIWMLRYLHENGYPQINLAKRSPSKREYLEYEKYFINIAKEKGRTSKELHQAIWCRVSTWYKKIEGTAQLELHLFKK